MIILIAESKTMHLQEDEITSTLLNSHIPVGEKSADKIMARISLMNMEDLSEVVKISPAMAAKLHRMAYEFPNKQQGIEAINAFTGVVFRNFDFGSLTVLEKTRVERDVRIISSLYGWLKPSDIIKPYRFDYSTPLAPSDQTFAAYWKKDVTIQLVKELQSSGDNNILNLLPTDAAKCVDWKLVKRFARVWKADFKEQNGDSVMTPHAGKLKALRGLLLREIITKDIRTPGSLLSLESDHMLPAGTPDYPDHIAFICS